MNKTIRLFGLFFLIVFLVQSGQLLGIDRGENTKHSLSHNDYDSWKSIYRPAISDDGKWVLYLETPQDGEAEIVVINLKSRDEYRHAIGYSGEGTDAERAALAEFNSDGTQVLFLISPSQAEVKEAKKEKKKKDKDKPKKKLGIMDLSSGKVIIVDRIKSFLLPEDAPNWIAYLKEALPEAEKKEEEKEEKKAEEKEEEKEDKKKDKKRKYGTSLILRSFKDGAETEFTDVLECYFSKNGKKLFYIVSSEDKPETDGVYMAAPGQDRGVSLLTGKGIYSKFAMNKDETCIAFLTDRDDQESKKPYFNLYGWEEGEAKASLWVSHTLQSYFPEGMAVSDKSDISFCEDGRIVMFGIKDIPAPKNEEDEGEEEEEAKFDLWHWNDPYPQPQQKLMADEVRDNTWESVYHLSSKSFVKLADKEIPDVQLSDNGKVAFARTIWPYAKRVAYFGSYYDVYVINPQTGKKTLVKKELYGRASLSPAGKYVYWFLKGDWFVYDIASGTTKNITESIDINFEQYDWDRPNPKGSYGIAGWTDDDAAILLNDRYDIWEISPDGSNSRMITEGYGRSHDLSMRYVRLDPDEKTINPKKSILLKAVDQNTMAEGFFRDRVDGSKKPVKLMMLDRTIRPFIKAKKEDRFLYASSTFEEYPDLWTCDADFRKPEKITALGRQMEPFIWGKSEMRDFLNADGKPLKGILVKPENFDANKKYPLMVYIYETLHQGRHRYRHPSPGSSINPPYYVSNGYILWMPDIEYDTGYPGQDALKCVLPGIHMLIREGYIDPEAIGIQGHSWGGYQIAYMITQTNIFAASVAGAPVSNMTSAYGGIRWGSGRVRQFQYERTQSRLGDTLWKVPLRYIENSPIFWADKIQTPVMYMHNDEDGAVPWYQGIEFIMALRRLEREAYMFNYNGEAHGLRKRVNQEDWTIRMAEFFDHHLKGAPIPDWMKSGIKAWEKEKNEVK
jgi:dipeptidyl aminopeptidase/acylaminoacyl peptidase